MMLRLLRRLVGIRQVIGQAAAIAAAREECIRRGWPWDEPIVVSEGLLVYSIWTNARSRGGNVSVRVRCNDGSILTSGMVPY